MAQSTTCSVPGIERPKSRFQTRPTHNDTLRSLLADVKRPGKPAGPFHVAMEAAASP